MREETIEHQTACDCHDVVRVRNRYFTGKFMTARDFQVDQDYMVTQMRWHNRLFHGWGIVCGLEVQPHPDYGNKLPTDCGWRWVVVKAGVALDCCGRALVLEQDTAFELPIPPKKSGKEQSAADLWRSPFLLCLHYYEEKIEVVPALYAEDECDPQRREANRVRETVRLSICDPQDMPDCWLYAGDDPEARCHDDCGDEQPGPAGVCLGTHCVCGGAVPLALITPHSGQDEDGKGYQISMQGRPQLSPRGDFLTSIVHIDWPHGGQLSLSTLRERDGELRVWFDRKIKPADGFKSGVNEFTFALQHGDIDEDLEFVKPEEGWPRLEKDRCAVFKIDEDLLDTRRGSIAGDIIYITLKCDFIIDCHNNPVDGNHLRGRLPSGNGVPGGVFESWFRVAYDRREEVDSKWQTAA